LPASRSLLKFHVWAAPTGTALLIGSNDDEGTELLPPTKPEALGALECRRFGAECDAVAHLYNAADAESADVAEDRMLSDYVFAASTRESDAFAAQARRPISTASPGLRRALNQPKSGHPTLPNLYMCLGPRTPPTYHGRMATGKCRIRCNAIGQISLRA
jgi:hypothetical protein